MKKNILTLFSFALLLTVVSCSTGTTESTSSATVSELQASNNRSAHAADEEEEAEKGKIWALRWGWVIFLRHILCCFLVEL